MLEPAQTAFAFSPHAVPPAPTGALLMASAGRDSCLRRAPLAAVLMAVRRHHCLTLRVHRGRREQRPPAPCSGTWAGRETVRLPPSPCEQEDGAGRGLFRGWQPSFSTSLCPERGVCPCNQSAHGFQSPQPVSDSVCTAYTLCTIPQNAVVQPSHGTLSSPTTVSDSNSQNDQPARTALTHTHHLGLVTTRSTQKCVSVSIFSEFSP